MLSVLAGLLESLFPAGGDGFTRTGGSGAKGNSGPWSFMSSCSCPCNTCRAAASSSREPLKFAGSTSDHLVAIAIRTSSSLRARVPCCSSSSCRGIFSSSFVTVPSQTCSGCVDPLQADSARTIMAARTIPTGMARTGPASASAFMESDIVLAMASAPDPPLGQTSQKSLKS